jgi:hypothetical protein
MKRVLFAILLFSTSNLYAAIPGLRTVYNPFLGGLDYVAMSSTGSSVECSTCFVHNIGAPYPNEGFSVASGSATTFLQNGAVVVDTSGSTQSKTGGLNVQGYLGVGTLAPTERLQVSSNSINIFEVNNASAVFRVHPVVRGYPFSQGDLGDGEKFRLLGRETCSRISSENGIGFTFSFYAGCSNAPEPNIGIANTGGYTWHTVGDAGLSVRRMNLTNEGYLGIGVSTPTFGVDVEKLNGYANAKFGETWPIYLMSSIGSVIGFNNYLDGSLNFKQGKGSSEDYAGNMVFNPTLGYFLFQLSTNTASEGDSITQQNIMIIRNSGRVGIGTVSPTDNLDVVGGVISSSVTVRDASETGTMILSSDGTSGIIEPSGTNTQIKAKTKLQVDGNFDVITGSSAFSNSVYVGSQTANGIGLDVEKGRNRYVFGKFGNDQPFYISAAVGVVNLGFNQYYDLSLHRNGKGAPRFGGSLFFNTSTGDMQWMITPSTVAADGFSLNRTVFSVTPKGEFGIGTTAPTARLHISTPSTPTGPLVIASVGAQKVLEVNASSTVVSGATNPQLIIDSPDTETPSGIRLSEGGTPRWSAFTSNRDLYINNSPTLVSANDRMILQDDGKVIVSSDLAVGVALSGGIVPNAVFSVSADPTRASAQIASTTVIPGGLVGIGTLNPTAQLDIVSSLSAGKALDIKSGVFTVQRNGNVGIGTQNPGGNATLDIRRTDAFPIATRLNQDNATKQYTGNILARQGTEIWFDGINDINNFYRFRAASTDHMVISTNGHVGIGTTVPTVRVETFDSALNHVILNRNSATVGPQIKFQTQGTDRWVFKGGNNSSVFDFALLDGSGNNRLTVLSGGNVGIGTSSPDAKLTVIGAGGSDHVLKIANPQTTATPANVNITATGFVREVTSNRAGKRDIRDLLSSTLDYYLILNLHPRSFLDVNPAKKYWPENTIFALDENKNKIEVKTEKKKIKELKEVCDDDGRNCKTVEVETEITLSTVTVPLKERFELNTEERWTLDYTDAERTLGVIADEAAAVAPDLVTYKNGEPWAVNYDRAWIYFLPILKDMKARIETLEAEVATLKNR